MRAEITAQIVFLGTRNLTATSEFYEQTLGFRLAVDQGSCHIYEVTRGAFIGFCERDQVSENNGVIVSFVTDDVHGLYEKLRKHGAQIEQEPAYSPEFNIYHCFFRDPNGYRLEVQCFADLDWANSSDK